MYILSRVYSTQLHSSINVITLSQIFLPFEEARMMATAPYRLQIFLADDVREALREVAHQQKTSIQKLVTRWLIEKLREYPAGEELEVPQDS